MKKNSRLVFLFLIMMFMGILSISFAAEIEEDTALLLVDIQEFYFPGGTSELVDPEAASLNAQKLLRAFRKENRLVVHVRHDAKLGAEIHESVRPDEGEKVITKNHVNCFKQTDLLEYLTKHHINKLVVAGMMTHMCVEAAVRAAHDFDFETVLIHDACATRGLTFDGSTVSAADVHSSTLSSLDKYYAQVLDTTRFLEDF